MSLINVPVQKDWLKTIKKIELDTGITMAYQEMGNTEKPVMIMMHGFSDSSRATRMIATHLVNDFHMYALDLRGHGCTDKPKQFAYTSYQYMEDVKSFAEKMGIDSFDILGISMGSLAAQCVAYAMPEKVRHAILISSGARFRHNGKEMDEILRAFESFATTPPTVDEWVPTHDRFDDQGFVEEMYKEAIKWPVYCWKAGWRGMEITDNTKFLQYIKAPTICMWGSEDDIFTEEYQKELLSNIPDVEAVYFDGASHEIQQEKHQEIANQIKNLYSIDY